MLPGDANDSLTSLAQRLVDLGGIDPPDPIRCCCTRRSCTTQRGVEALGEKLKISGEVGSALLERYEALEKQYAESIEGYERQVSRVPLVR